MSLQRNGFKVRIFQRAMRFADWLSRLPNRMVPPPFHLIQIGSSFWLSRSLYLAAELGIADLLDERRKAVADIAGELGLYEDSLYRLLRMLAANDIFEEIEPGVFANSRLSHHLRSDHPQSVRAMVRMHNSPVMAKPWFEALEQGVRRGKPPFVLVHGDELYSYMDRHPDFDTLFAEAMASVEALTGTDYLQDFDWGRFDRLVDVGGSRGQKAMEILRLSPDLRALVFDRRQVIEGAREYWSERVDEQTLQRIEFSSGDMTQQIPAAVSDHDLYLFFAIFHGMGDREAAQVLRRLGAALGNHRPGILIVDMVMPPAGADASSASFDMQMLVNTYGRERTLEEWAGLLSGEGFVIDEVIAVRTFARFLVVKRG